MDKISFDHTNLLHSVDAVKPNALLVVKTRDNQLHLCRVTRIEHTARGSMVVLHEGCEVPNFCWNEYEVGESKVWRVWLLPDNILVKGDLAPL